MKHYIILNNPKSVDSKVVYNQIEKLIKEGKKTNEIAWKMKFVTTDKVVKDISAKFQALKNRIAFKIKG